MSTKRPRQQKFSSSGAADGGETPASAGDGGPALASADSGGGAPPNAGSAPAGAGRAAKVAPVLVPPPPRPGVAGAPQAPSGGAAQASAGSGAAKASVVSGAAGSKPEHHVEKSVTTVVVEVPILVNHKTLLRGDFLYVYKPAKDKDSEPQAIENKRLRAHALLDSTVQCCPPQNSSVYSRVPRNKNRTALQQYCTAQSFTGQCSTVLPHSRLPCCPWRFCISKSPLAPNSEQHSALPLYSTVQYRTVQFGTVP